MTDKKTKKEKPSYEIEYLRRATIDADYNYCEFRVVFDPAKIDCKTVVQDTETMVVFARELTATEEPEQPVKKPAKKAPAKEVGKTEDIKITDLQAGDKVNISVKLVKPINPEKDIKAFINKTDGSAGKRCKTIVEDDSGTIQLTLFDEQIDLVQDMKENAWFSIANGYVKEWQGNLELVVGKYGKIEGVFNG